MLSSDLKSSLTLSWAHQRHLSLHSTFYSSLWQGNNSASVFFILLQKCTQWSFPWLHPNSSSLLLQLLYGTLTSALCPHYLYVRTKPERKPPLRPARTRRPAVRQRTLQIWYTHTLIFLISPFLAVPITWGLRGEKGKANWHSSNAWL